MPSHARPDNRLKAGPTIEKPFGGGKVEDNLGLEVSSKGFEHKIAAEHKGKSNTSREAAVRLIKRERKLTQ